jgi:integrase
MRDVTKPEEPDHRERVITGPEIRTMLRELGWGRKLPVRSVAQAVAHCFLAALQTGMRAGELAGCGGVMCETITAHCMQGAPRMAKHPKCL